jgi:hypothetical protein
MWKEPGLIDRILDDGTALEKWLTFAGIAFLSVAGLIAIIVVGAVLAIAILTPLREYIGDFVYLIGLALIGVWLLGLGLCAFGLRMLRRKIRESHQDRL